MDIANMNLTEVGWEGVGWICLVHSKDLWWDLVNTAINFLVL
jgi:hypothetical protein